MEFKSISELRTEYRDNPDYAIQSVIPDMINELKADSKYAGYTDEQLEGIAKAKLSTLNGLMLNGDFSKHIPNNGLPTGTKWSEYSYEEILAMEQNGVNIPKEFTDWAHSMQDADATNYVIDESELNNSSSLEEVDQATEDPQDAIAKKAVAYSKKCAQQESNLNNALVDLEPKKEKVQEIQNQMKNEQKDGMQKLTDMAKRWNELDKKIQNGENLTELEKKEYAQLNKNLNGASADLRNKMTETADNLDAMVVSMDNIAKDIESDIDLSNETIELANTLAGVQKGYNPTSIPNKMSFMAIGEVANMIYGAKGKSIARDTVDAGIDLQELANDSQVKINKETSLYDFALEYGSTLNDQLSEVERLLGENPNKDDRTVLTKAENKAGEQAEDNAMATANEAVENALPAEPETEVTTGTPDKNVNDKASGNMAPATSVEDAATQTKTAQAAPVEVKESSNGKSKSSSAPSKGSSKPEETLDEQGESATEDARSTSPKVESRGVEAETETKDAEKTQKAAKKENKEVVAEQKEVDKKSKQVNADLKHNNAQSATLNDELTADTDAMVESITANPDEAQARAESIAITGGKITALGLESGKKATEFTEETSELEEDAEKSQKQNEKSQKNNSKVEKAISVIDQIAAVGLQKGMSTIGTGVVMTAQGQVMVSTGSALLATPWTAAAGAALITAGTTTANIGLGAINVGSILSTASFYTLAATKVTKMTIAACNGDLKGVFKNLGAFATVCATSVASCAATMAVGAATMGVAGPVGTAIASQAAALPFDVIGGAANMNLSNDNLKSDKNAGIKARVAQKLDEEASTETASTQTSQSAPAVQTTQPANQVAAATAQPVVAQAAPAQQASAQAASQEETEETEETTENNEVAGEEEQETELNAAQQARADMQDSGASKRDIAKAMFKQSKQLESQTKPSIIASALTSSKAKSISESANGVAELAVAMTKSMRNEYDELSDKVEKDKETADPSDIEKMEDLKDKIQSKGSKAQDKLADYDAKLYALQAKSAAFSQIAEDANIWGEETILSGYDLLGVQSSGEAENVSGSPIRALFKHGIDGFIAVRTINQGASTVAAGEKSAEALEVAQNAVASSLNSTNASKAKVQEATFAEAKAAPGSEATGAENNASAESEAPAQEENTADAAAATPAPANQSATAVPTAAPAQNSQNKTLAPANNAGNSVPAAAQNVVDGVEEVTETTTNDGKPAGSFASFQARMAAANKINKESAADSPASTGEGSKSDGNKKEEEVTEDSVNTAEGKRTADENKKEGENVEKENKDKNKASKDAKKEGKDLEKSDKQLQKEIKASQKEIKAIEEKILKLSDESLAIVEEIEAEGEQSQAQSQAAPAGQPAVAGVQPAAANASMSAGAPTGGAASVSSVPSNMNASAPAATNSSAAFDVSGGKIQKLSEKITANVAQIAGLQSRGTKSAKRLQKNIKTQQKRSEKAQKAAEKEQKQNEKLDKALTYVDYAATATKITGQIFNGVGAAQVTAGTAMIAVGTPMIPIPWTAAAGAALVASGTTLETTGTSNIGVGNVLNMVGTYTGMAVKLTKITIAACQGNLMGVLTNAAALGMSCMGGLPGVEDAAKAVDAAAQAGQQLGNNLVAQAQMQIAGNAMQQTTQSMLANSSSEILRATAQQMTVMTTEEATKAAFGTAAKQAMAGATKKALTKAAFGAVTKGAMETVGSMAVGAAGAMLSKPSTGEEEKQKRELHLTNRKRTARVIKAINRRKGSSQYGRQGR